MVLVRAQAGYCAVRHCGQTASPPQGGTYTSLQTVRAPERAGASVKFGGERLRKSHLPCGVAFPLRLDPHRNSLKPKRLWFVVARQSFGGLGPSDHGGGIVHGHTRTAVRRGMAGVCSTWLSCIERLPEVVARLKCTQILTGDALRALRCTDTPDCLAYCDPPYVHGTRACSGYAHEMTDADHEALVAYLLTEWTGKVVLSGYAHPLYEPLEAAGWHRIDWQTACYAAGRTRATGILCDGAAFATQARTESVWLCPRTAAEVLPAAQRAMDLEVTAG